MIAAVLVSLVLMQQQQEPVHEVGSRKQLFVDHKFIESAEGVTLGMHAPVRTGEVLVTADAPWERGLTISSYSSVLRENGKTRLWYNIRDIEHAPGKNPEFMGVAYAESTDGIHFTKPRLGLVLHGGSRENNLVMPPDPQQLAQGGGSVAIDTNPDCPPAERYKSWQKIYPKAGTGIKGPHRMFVSPDGLRWRLSERLFTGLRAADTQPTWFWDARRRKYAGYSREWVQFELGRRIRMASYNESPDLYNWSNMQIALEPDAGDYAGEPRPMVDLSRMTLQGENLTAAVASSSQRRNGLSDGDDRVKAGEDQVPAPGAPVDIYGPGVFPYEGVYVSLAARFHPWKPREGGQPRATWPDTSDVQLSVSRDGVHFQKPSREPFLRTGMAGSFDSKWIWPLAPQPVVMGDEIWIYYYGTNQDHSGGLDGDDAAAKSGIGRAVLRLDGFVSADFDAVAGGTLTTPLLRFPSGSTLLELNLDTGAGGVGRVEILDEQGFPIPGYSLRESDDLNVNSVRARASWGGGKTDVSALAERAIRLRFRMRSAKLYAFQFR